TKLLFKKQAVAATELVEAERKLRISVAQLEQARAEKRARQAKGVLEAETELARRQNECADARSQLKLLELGSRPEATEAGQAIVVRLQAELDHLQEVHKLLPVHSPVAGTITTPRLREKVGHYVKEGEIIASVDDLDSLQAEIALTEQDVARVRPGQKALF